MRTALVEAGASIDDVISTRVLVASTSQADLVNACELVMSDSVANSQAPRPSAQMQALGRLVGTWKVSDGAQGTVAYEWMEGASSSFSTSTSNRRASESPVSR